MIWLWEGKLFTRDTNSWAVVSSRFPRLFCRSASSREACRTCKKEARCLLLLGTREFCPPERPWWCEVRTKQHIRSWPHESDSTERHVESLPTGSSVSWRKVGLLHAMESPAIFLTRIGVGIIIFESYRHSQGTFTNAESAQKVITSLERGLGR